MNPEWTGGPMIGGAVILVVVIVHSPDHMHQRGSPHTGRKPPFMRITLGKPKDSGFTLLELMVVAAIIVIMVVVAIPNFGTFMANVRLKNAADDLFFTLQQTRMNAIRGGGRWMVLFSGSSYQVINCTDNRCDTAEDNVVVKEVPFSTFKGITFSDTFANHQVQFAPDGMVDKPSSVTGPEIGRITVSNNRGRIKDIRILESGIIHMTSN